MEKKRKKKRGDRGEMPGKKRSMHQARADRHARIQVKTQRTGRIWSAELPGDWNHK